MRENKDKEEEEYYIFDGSDIEHFYSDTETNMNKRVKIKNNLTSTYRGNKIYQLNSSLFKTKNIFNEYYNSKIHFGTVIEDILILSKKE